MNDFAAGVPKKDFVDEARDELVCPLCMGTFVQPLSLTCLHSYCQSCLVTLVKVNGSSEGVDCPECRAATKLPAGGVKDLPINFKLKRFVEILTVEERQTILRRGSRRKMNSHRDDLMCPTHHDKILEYYCCPCKAVICGQCMLDEHRVHGEVRYVREILKQHVTELRNVIPDLERVSAEGKVTVSRMKKNSKKLEACLENEVSLIHSYFAGILEILKEKEKEVVLDLKCRASRKEKMTQNHVSRLNGALEEVERCRQVVEDACERRANDPTLLESEAQIFERVQTGRRLVEEQVMDFKSVQTELSSLTSFLPDPQVESFCRAIHYTSASPVRDRRARSSVLSESDNEVSATPLTRIRSDAMLPSMDSKLATRPFSTFSAPNKASSPFSAILPDRCSAISTATKIVQENGTDIVQPLSDIGGKNLIGPYNHITAYPHGVFCLSQGTLLVTDCQHHLFRIVTATGKCLETVGAEGKGDGQFCEPSVISGTTDGSILVADGKGTGRVQKFSSSGKFLSKFKVRSLTSGCYMSEPAGMVVLDSRDVLVTDCSKSCIHQFDESGKYLGKFGNLMDLKEPAGIAASKTRVVIADRSRHIIYILTQHGQLLSKIGHPGSAPGQLSVPYGIAIDARGYIFVSESGNHRISIFNPGGKFERCFGGMGSESGKFNTPRHICFNHQGHLVVCDEQNQRLQIFNISLS